MYMYMLQICVKILNLYKGLFFALIDTYVVFIYQILSVLHILIQLILTTVI